MAVAVQPAAPRCAAAAGRPAPAGGSSAARLPRRSSPWSRCIGRRAQPGLLVAASSAQRARRRCSSSCSTRPGLGRGRADAPGDLSAAAARRPVRRARRPERAAGVRVHDALVQRWELALFGAQVSREWWQAAPSRVLVHRAARRRTSRTTSSCRCPRFYFLWRGDLAAVRRFVLAVMTTFVVCYLVFIFFPVAGPYYMFPRPAAWFIDNPPARLVYDTLAEGSSYGAAFPSSHVAAAVAAALAARRAPGGSGSLLLVPTRAADGRRGVLPDALRGGCAGRALAVARRSRVSVARLTPSRRPDGRRRPRRGCAA